MAIAKRSCCARRAPASWSCAIIRGKGASCSIGDPVFIGLPIAMLPDATSLRVKAVLADVDDGKIAPGMRASITLDGYPDVVYTGRVAAISAVAQESKRQSLRRQFDVIVALDRLDEQRMRPGLSARIVVRREAQPERAARAARGDRLLRQDARARSLSPGTMRRT
jgi:multidrug resistance efflux pump